MSIKSKNATIAEFIHDPVGVFLVFILIVIFGLAVFGSFYHRNVRGEGLSESQVLMLGL